MKHAVRLLLAVVVAGSIVSRAAAVSLTFTDEATFLSAVASTTKESFEGLTATNGPTANFFDLPDFDISVTSPVSPGAGIFNVPLAGGFATDGSNWLAYQSDVNDTLRFDFDTPINAFGINITDWGDFRPGSLFFSNDAGDNFTVAVSPQSNGNLIFFGLINPTMSFTQIVFTNTADNEGYGIDEVYYSSSPANPIPEPSTLLLLASGLGGLGFVRWRKKRRTS